MKNMKRTISFALAVGALSVLIPVPIARGYSFWSELNELFADTYGQAKVYLNGLLAETYSDQAPFVRDAINAALGPLELSDPLIVEERIKEGAIATGEVFDLSQPPALVRASAISKEVDRQRLRSHVASVIGQDGQAAIQMKLEQSSVTLEETQELGFLAEEAFSTQEAIKKIAQQNVKSTELLGALQAEAINSRIDTQFEAEVLSNISQTLDEERTIQQNRDLAGVATSLSLAAQATLF